ncbi:uncharacterized protein EV420DRAFT_1480087 [Desarmillaria tabescens]|uniref:Uncharacterized protein n=1 Tax=Armillaria tabescens TaxID=1929756 RepID=A0AA39KEK8_ARMTA|nr:uncharacterized protein EV420DRAFT_1480087 [Desarmillaria tabescens]KAK0458364.1 hypothetical protein EV420DRAFT_1480087 [Desarmillaria tabescens]
MFKPMEQVPPLVSDALIPEGKLSLGRTPGTVKIRITCKTTVRDEAQMPPENSHRQPVTKEEAMLRWQTDIKFSLVGYPVFRTVRDLPSKSVVKSKRMYKAVRHNKPANLSKAHFHVRTLVAKVAFFSNCMSPSASGSMPAAKSDAQLQASSIISALYFTIEDSHPPRATHISFLFALLDFSVTHTAYSPESPKLTFYPAGKPFVLRFAPWLSAHGNAMRTSIHRPDGCAATYASNPQFYCKSLSVIGSVG